MTGGNYTGTSLERRFTSNIGGFLPRLMLTPEPEGHGAARSVCRALSYHGADGRSLLVRSLEIKGSAAGRRRCVSLPQQHLLLRHIQLCTTRIGPPTWLASPSSVRSGATTRRGEWKVTAQVGQASCAGGTTRQTGRRDATPMPCGSCPSMAALTRSGARKASEIVMLIFRVVQPSRPAMLSVVAAGSAMSSSSQRRPRAIDATRSARFSERIGRACLGLRSFGYENLTMSGG
jgi:hypothetical protein